MATLTNMSGKCKVCRNRYKTGISK